MYSASQQSNTLSGRVTAEGDELFYEVRGQGSPLLMICGGGGDSWGTTHWPTGSPGSTG